MAAKNVLNWICRINPWLFRYFIRLTGNGRDGKQKLVHTDVEECLDDYTANGTGIGIRPFFTNLELISRDLSLLILH